MYSGGIGISSLESNGRVETYYMTGGILKVDFTYSARPIAPHPLVLDNRGCVAFMRGPFVYCAETVDNPQIKDLRAIRIIPGRTPREFVEKREFSEWGLDPIILKVDVIILEDGVRKEDEVTVIPVCLWANRARSDLRVWLPSLLPDEA